MPTGISYVNTNESRRGEVTAYHNKPQPLFLNKTKFSYDISGLPKKAQRQLVSFNGVEHSTKFTIGFEIEKTALHRGAVREYPLFCGFERDSSCGYEAVTHILPLLPPSMWRTKVFNMFVEAEKVIDDNYSPSDRRCGGHISVGIEGMTGEQIREVMRKNCGILMAIYNNRLKTGYCSHNRRMHARWDSSSHENGTHHKYHLALEKSEILEFRLPSRVKSVKQLMSRYELMYEIVDFSVNCPNGSHSVLMNRIRPILFRMYGTTDRVEEAIDQAKDFRQFILTGKVTDKIRPFLY